jgi:hypothetical protein
MPGTLALFPAADLMRRERKVAEKNIAGGLDKVKVSWYNPKCRLGETQIWNSQARIAE